MSVAIIAFVGSGKSGLEIRREFSAPPYGWPQDAIDGVLTTLLASSHLSARINTNPLSLAEVDQRKLGQAVFRTESPVLTAAQKLAIRKLFQEAGLSRITPGDELADALRFVEHAKTIAAQAGGDAPAPVAPAAPELGALESHSGNDLLMELHDQRDALLARITTWQSTGKEISRRLPVFLLAEKLVAQAIGLAQQSDWAAALTAIRANRSLLDDPDPVSHVLKETGNVLRAAVTQAHNSYSEMFVHQTERLDSNPVWHNLSEDKRRSLLASSGALQKTMPVIDTNEQLIAALQSCSLSNWQSYTDALTAQFDRALAAAILESEPKARRISLPPITIRNRAELDEWIAQLQNTIEEALREGPVIL